MTVALSVVNSITPTASQTAVGGTVNDPIVAIANNPILPGFGSFVLPSGTTGQRLLQGAGSMRFNTTTGFFEASTDGATWVNLAVGGGGIASVTGTALQIDCTAGPNVVVSIDAGYLGQASITTLGTITAGTWHGTAIDETHGGTNQTTYALGDTLYASAANTLHKLAGNTTAGIQYLAQTGTGVVSAAPIWTTISGGDITGAALTKTDDTNVTMTLGGTPNTALLRAASMTLGWAGQLSLARGGTNANLTASNGGIVWSNATQMQILAGTATANLMLLSGSTATPAWSTSTIPTSAGAVAGKVLASDGTNYVLSTAVFPVASAAAGKFIISDGTNWIASTPTLPNTAGTAGKILRSDGTNFVDSTSTFADTYAASTLLYSNGANAVTGLATANSASLITSSAGVPAWSGTMTNGQVIIGSTGATPTAATLTAGTNITITNGAGSITIAAAAGAAAYYVRYPGGSNVITESSNVASITNNATGDETVTYTAAFATANYISVGGSQVTSGPSASYTSIYSYNNSGTVGQSAPSTSASRHININSMGNFANTLTCVVGFGT